jgi:hypothetical protein
MAPSARIPASVVAVWTFGEGAECRDRRKTTSRYHAEKQNDRESKSDKYLTQDVVRGVIQQHNDMEMKE